MPCQAANEVIPGVILRVAVCVWIVKIVSEDDRKLLLKIIPTEQRQSHGLTAAQAAPGLEVVRNRAKKSLNAYVELTRLGISCEQRSCQRAVTHGSFGNCRACRIGDARAVCIVTIERDLNILEGLKEKIGVVPLVLIGLRFVSASVGDHDPVVDISPLIDSSPQCRTEVSRWDDAPEIHNGFFQRPVSPERFRNIIRWCRLLAEPKIRSGEDVFPSEKCVLYENTDLPIA